MAGHLLNVALKLEGESTGEVAQGRGGAIRGSGTERCHIKAGAAKSNLVLDAVIVKMSPKEAISTLAPELKEVPSADWNKIRRITQAKTAPGDTVIIVGIGNTIGTE